MTLALLILGNESIKFGNVVVYLEPLIKNCNCYGLSQLKENNFLHQIGFSSHNFSPTEINYKISDKE
jgi:hypothetical protein